MILFNFIFKIKILIYIFWIKKKWEKCSRIKFYKVIWLSNKTKNKVDSNGIVSLQKWHLWDWRGMGSSYIWEWILKETEKEF